MVERGQLLPCGVGGRTVPQRRERGCTGSVRKGPVLMTERVVYLGAVGHILCVLVNMWFSGQNIHSFRYILNESRT